MSRSYKCTTTPSTTNTADHEANTLASTPTSIPVSCHQFTLQGRLLFSTSSALSAIWRLNPEFLTEEDLVRGLLSNQRNNCKAAMDYKAAKLAGPLLNDREKSPHIITKYDLFKIHVMLRLWVQSSLHAVTHAGNVIR